MAHCASNLIVLNSIDEIRNIKKKRPDRETIIKFAEREYGLGAEDTKNSLDSLIQSKSIYVKVKRGKESFFVDMLQDDPGLPSENKEIETGKESSLRERPSSSCEFRPSDSESNHKRQQEAQNGKIRKISSDEERLVELRAELSDKAAKQEKYIEISAEEGDSDDSESLSSDGESDSDLERGRTRLQSGLVAQSFGSEKGEPLQNENGFNLTRNTTQKSSIAEKESLSDDTKQRLDFIERQLSSILNRLDKQDSEGKNERHIKDKDFQEMLAKIWLLEKENKALSDENLALKLENSEIKEFFIKDVYEKNKNEKERSHPSLEKFKESTHMEEQKKQVGWRIPGSSQGKLQDYNNYYKYQRKLFAKTGLVYLQIVRTEKEMNRKKD